MKNETTPHLRPVWKIYEDVRTVEEYLELKRTHQKKEQMQRYRARTKQPWLRIPR